MERVRGADAVAQLDAFLLGLLLLCRSSRIGPTHLRDDLLVRGRCGRGIRFGRHRVQQAALDDAKDFIPLHWLAPLVLSRGEMVNRLEQIDVVERFAFARLQGENQHAVGRVSDRNCEMFQEAQSFVTQGRVEGFDTSRTDEVFENLIQQDQIGRVAEQF
jgi:hypothetical protein